MKRRLAMIGVLFVFLVCSMGSAFAAEVDKMILYENETYKFKMEYPEGWMLQEGFMGSAALFMSTSEPASEFHPNVNIIVQDISKYPNLTLEQYCEINILQLEKVITDFRLLSNEKRLLTSTPATVLIVDGKQGVYNLRWVQAYTLHNNKAYIITFTSDIAQFSKYKDVANKIINSFTTN